VLVEAGEHAHYVVFEDIEERAGEAIEIRPPNLALDTGVQAWIAGEKAVGPLKPVDRGIVHADVSLAVPLVYRRRFEPCQRLLDDPEGLA
jgi:hypothetical protein